MPTFISHLNTMLLAAVLAPGLAAHGQTLEGASPAWLSKPAINPVPHWYEVRGGAWRVPAEMVADMAAGIQAEAGAAVRARLDTYTIQYQGESAGNARTVRLMGACDTPGMQERALSDRFLVVDDGGKCFFDATYDPVQKRFMSLDYHGNA
jgi:hypothetical protein